jgi:hypothetical protein
VPLNETRAAVNSSPQAFSEADYQKQRKKDQEENESRYNTVLLYKVPEMDSEGIELDDGKAAIDALIQFNVDQTVIDSIEGTERRGSSNEQKRPLLIRFAMKDAALKVVRGRYGKKATIGSSTDVEVKFNRTEWLREAYRRMYAVIEYLQEIRPELKTEVKFGMGHVGGWKFAPQDFQRPFIVLRGEFLPIYEYLKDLEGANKFRFY